MTRWTSPNRRSKPTIETWGQCIIGTARVRFRESEYDLTDNMYGNTTPTHDSLIDIDATTGGGTKVGLKLPGYIKSGVVLKHDAALFLILALLKREYIFFDSNAQHDVLRQFVIDVATGACWVGDDACSVDDSSQWKPWNSSTSDNCPALVQEYVRLRSAASQELPAQRIPRVFPKLELRRDELVVEAIFAIFGLIALPVRLLLFPARWFRARQEFREALARQREQQRKWVDFRNKLTEAPLTPGTGEFFAGT